MAWTALPTSEGSFSLNANILANSVGSSLDDMLDEATNLSESLADAIDAIKVQINTDITGLSMDFSPSLDTTTALNAPSVPTTPALDTAPSAPSTSGQLLDDAAYSGAFGLGRDAVLQEEQRELWEAEAGAAANGIGLPSAVSQGMLVAAQQARRQATSKVALEQATLKASHLREDLRWAYEQQLAYYDTKQRNVLARFAAQINELQGALAKEAARLQWKANSNQTEFERAKYATEASLQLQQFATKISQDATLAYAGALAEQFKAWLAAVSFRADTGSNVANVSYVGA